MSLSPVLSSLEREFREAQETTRRLVESVTDAEWNKKPVGGGWSVGECIAHLNLTNEAYLPLVREAITEGKKTAFRGSVPGPRLDLMGRVLCWIMEPPVRKLKSKTAPGFSPSVPADRVLTLGKFSQLQGSLLEELQAAVGLNLGRLKIRSPFSPRIRYNLYSCFRILAAHERRHLWQAEQVLGRRTRPAQVE